MTTKLALKIGQASNKGVKEINQDFFGVMHPENIQLTTKGVTLALADGISSSQVSQIASETAVSSFLQDYYCTSDTWSVKTAGVKVLSATNSWLYSQSQNGPDRFDKDKGYVCTFSSLVFKSNSAYLFHVGDSRIYRKVGNNFEQLTQDHRKVISPDTSYLTNALGVSNVLDVDYKELAVVQGDVFIIATDGVYEFVSAKELSQCIDNSAGDLQQAAEAVVELALKNGSDDNLTIQIAEVMSLPERALTEVNQQLELSPPPEQLQARMEFDGFEIKREIHISSRSHVFLAKDIETEQLVVIKTPSTEMKKDQAYLECMLMEDWIAKRINSPFVLKAAGRDKVKNYLYTLTEWVEGKTLSQWIIDNPKPAMDRVRNIIDQIGKGLQAFHRKEMIHQDLRPQNILIDESDTVKIIDFGAVRVAGVSEIGEFNNGIVGTAQYSAPEYYLGEGIHQRVDIFSLGVIAYQMISGQLPFSSLVSKAANRKALNKITYTPLHHREVKIEPFVDHAIRKACHLEPHKRYQEVSEFLFDLRRPSKQFSTEQKPPLLERDPVTFWKTTTVILALMLVWQLVSK